MALKETIRPSECPHCGKFASRPPGWLKVVAGLAPGTGRDEPRHTITDVSRICGIKRSLASFLVERAVRDGAMRRSGRGGSTGNKQTYQRTVYGRRLLEMWKLSGWTSGRNQ